MANQEEMVLRELGNKLQECRELVARVPGGYTVRMLLDKAFNIVAKWAKENSDA